jgi:HPt (histidine-containing phosphotransfer) domain-containing protein
MMEKTMTQKVIVEVDADLADLVPNFLANRQKDLQQIAIALEKADNNALRIIGHNMKGVGGGYGFGDITEFGKQIEAAAKDGNHDAVRALRSEYEQYLANLEVRYVT